VGIAAGVAAEQAGVARRDEDLHAGQLLRQRVEGADVVGVRVGDDDPHDRGAEPLRRRDDAARCAADVRIDEREAVVLGNEPRVDELQAVDGHGLWHAAAG
jgi:hypothetical protein